MRALTAKEKAKEARLRREYHITLAEYNLVLKHQKGCCAICKRHQREFKLGFAVDHCHKTGLVRGLLCWVCNKIIAVAQDDGVRLGNASSYIAEPPMSVVLGERYTAPGRVGTKRRAKLLAALKVQSSKGVN